MSIHLETLHQAKAQQQPRYHSGPSKEIDGGKPLQKTLKDPSPNIAYRPGGLPIAPPAPPSPKKWCNRSKGWSREHTGVKSKDCACRFDCLFFFLKREKLEKPLYQMRISKDEQTCLPFELPKPMTDFADTPISFIPKPWPPGAFLPSPSVRPLFFFKPFPHSAQFPDPSPSPTHQQ